MKKLWKYLRYLMLALLVLLTLTIGGVAWWLWGWRVGGLSFHESWSEQQRTEMLGLADDMRHFQRDFVNSEFLRNEVTFYYKIGHKSSDNEESSQRSILDRLQYELAAAVGAKLIAGSILDTLKQLAADGAEHIAPQKAAMVAQAACRTQHIALAKELILLGADANAELTLPWLSKDLKGETCFQSAIACKPYFSDKLAPLPERIALLELMLEHGANPSINKHYTILSALISALTGDEPDRGAMMEWVLDHGVTVESASEIENVSLLLNCEGTLPTFKRIVQKGLIPLTPENKARMLHRCIACLTNDSAEKANWLLNDLGADPNYIITYTIEEEDDEGNSTTRESSWPICTEQIVKQLHYSSQDTATQERVLEMLDILLAHGAKMPENAAELVPQNPALRERYMELISKYTPTLPATQQ